MKDESVNTHETTQPTFGTFKRLFVSFELFSFKLKKKYIKDMYEVQESIIYLYSDVVDVENTGSKYVCISLRTYCISVPHNLIF